MELILSILAGVGLFFIWNESYERWFAESSRPEDERCT